MPALEKAVHLLQPGEKAFAVFTEGDRFEKNDADRTGSTGNWGVNVKRAQMLTHVIVYVRVSNNENKIYKGRYEGLEESGEGNLYRVLMSEIEFVGYTDRNWHEFADTGTNARRYLPQYEGDSL